MASLTPLLKGPYGLLQKRLAIFFGGVKSPQVLDSVIPNVSLNLYSSSRRFIQGLYNKDKDFIATVSSPYLTSFINKQIAQVQSQKVRITRTADEDAKNNLLIFPYVVFGQTMQDRLKSNNFMKTCRSYPLIGWNRYFRSRSSNESFGQYFRSFSEKQVYGFDCYLSEPAQNYKYFKNEELIPLQNSKVTHVISFETDSVNQEFWVVDYNHICLNNDRL